MERDVRRSFYHISLETFNLTIRNGFNFLETTLYVGFDSNQMYSLVEISVENIKVAVNSI
jgi:hypothetical protein